MRNEVPSRSRRSDMIAAFGGPLITIVIVILVVAAIVYFLRRT